MIFFDNIKPWWLQCKDQDISESKETATAAVTNPFAASTQTSTPKLNKSGNIPIANYKTSEELGLSIERTTQDEPIEVKTNPKDTTVATEDDKEFDSSTKGFEGSKGPGLDKTLTSFYGKKFTNASEEDKEKMTVRYFDWLSKDKKDVISQLDQFKLYRNRCKDKGEYKRLSSVIDKMEAKYQLGASKAVMTEGNDIQKNIGQKAVADDYQNYDKSVQKDVAGLIVDSKNQDAIRIGAGHISELYKENQDPVHENFFNLNDEDIQKILTGQLGKYDKDVQLSIYKRTMTSEYQDVLELGASNIYTLYKDNQVEATRLTVETGNEGVIKAAAKNVYLCDIDNQSKMKKQLSDSGYDSVQKALEESSVKAAELEAFKEQEKATESATELVEKEEEKATIATKTINEINTNDINNATKAELLELMRTLTPSQLIDYAGLILGGNTSPEIVAALMDRLNASNIPDSDRKKIFGQLGKSEKTIMENQLASLGTSAQRLFVNEAAQKGTLGQIKSNLLTASVKQEYNELTKNKI